MASRREQVLQAVKALHVAALPNATVKRNVDKPERIPPGGLVIIRDGDPGDPEVDLSPLVYHYQHRIPVEIASFEAIAQTPEQIAEVLDGWLSLIGAAIAEDPTLGGLCDHLEAEAPFTDELEMAGTLSGRWADLTLVAAYSTSNPLN